MAEKMKIYGKLTVGSDIYALLRPVPFEQEYYNQIGQAYYVAFWDTEKNNVYNPHVLIVSGNYHVDLFQGERDVMTYDNWKAEVNIRSLVIPEVAVSEV